MRLRLLAVATLAACGAESPGTTTPVTTTTTAVVPTALVIVAGNDQTGATNATLAKTLVVKAMTGTGVSAAGSEVTFTVSSGTATLTPATVTTDTSGQASTTVKLGAAAGSVQITATVKNTALTALFRASTVVPDPDSTAAATVYNPDWTEASHTKGTGPNYATAFPQEAVNTIEITMTTTQWAGIRTNMTALYGFDFGARVNAGAGFPDDDPDYIAATLKFNGKIWKKTGFRLKGNSTLASTWGNGNYKLPFRLKMAEWEDVYPAIKGQRFFGFKEISFSPGRSDPALIREKATADILRLAGIGAARTAFYRVFIDFGLGLKYCGVYTGVEVIDDTMVKDWFGEDKGNIYKPESRLTVFNETEFEKKNNKSPADFTDVKSLISALNDPLRTTNAAQWRANLEAVFHVDGFLKWLAVNNAIVNWDVYGAIAHNYYLYNHPTQRLTWIPWDHNEAMTGSPGILGTAGAPGGPNRGMSLTMNEASAGQWPLIRYLADDPVYLAKYKAFLKTFNSDVLILSNINAMFDRYTALISPFVVGTNGEQVGYTHTTSAAFLAGLPALKTHIANRKALVSEFVP